MLTHESFRWRDRHGQIYTLDEIDAGYLNNIIMYLERKQIALDIMGDMWLFSYNDDIEACELHDQSVALKNVISFLQKQLKHRRKDPWTLE